ncbi:MAG: hypothetical protein V4467_02300 [Patescibacteria group bacterium]
MPIKSTIQKSLFALASLVALGGGAGLVAVANAQSTSSTPPPQALHFGSKFEGSLLTKGPGVSGTVLSVSGNIIAVTGKNSTTTYSVNAANAKFFKMTDGKKPTTATIADIKVGDTVGVRGTVTGTSVVATEVIDGLFKPNLGHHGDQGEGKRGLGGTVSAVSGNTLTVKRPDGTIYTVNAGGAKIFKVVELSVADIKVGDTVGIQGSVSGTQVTATNILDGVLPKFPKPPKPTSN